MSPYHSRRTLPLVCLRIGSGKTTALAAIVLGAHAIFGGASLVALTTISVVVEREVFVVRVHG